MVTAKRGTGRWATRLVGIVALLVSLLIPGLALARNVSFGSVGTIDASGLSTLDSLINADLDGDGDQDLLVAAPDTDTVGWYINNGSGSYGAQQIVASPIDAVTSVAAYDLDNDGDLDVLGRSTGDNRVFWVANNGGGTFAAPVNLATSVADGLVAEAADLDNDGDLDVYAGTNQLVIYENTGGGTFAAGVAASGTYTSVSVANPGDVDNDGDVDLVVGASQDDLVVLYRNDGTGTFAAPVTLATPQFVERVLLNDLNRDSDLDLIIATNNNSGDDNLRWFPGNGNGTFGAQVNIPTADTWTVWVNSGDIDLDGDVDLVSGNENNANLSWHENLNSLGTSWTERTLSTAGLAAGNHLSALAYDADSDGDLDFAGSSGTGDSVYSFENRNVHRTASLAVTPSGIGNDPDGLAVGDINDDGIDDLVGDSVGGTVRYYLGNGDGSFGADNLVYSEPGTAVAVGQIDNDGQLDIAFAAAGRVWGTFNDSGTFDGNQVDTGTPIGNYTALQIADLDRDGDGDIVAINSVGDVFAIYKNAGLSFTVQTVATGLTNLNDFDLSDLDGDGDLDIVTATGDLADGNPSALAWYANAVGSFGAANSINTDIRGYRAVRAGDLDSDGDDDLVVAHLNDGTNYLSHFLNNGSGSFAARQGFGDPVDPRTIELVDFDSDGDLDVISQSIANNSIEIEENGGSANFATLYGLVSGTNVTFPVVIPANLNRDGRPDLIAYTVWDGAAPDFISSVINDGGSGSFLSFNTGVSTIGNGSTAAVSRILLISEAISGDPNIELTQLQVRFENSGAGTPMSASEADNLFAEVRLYSDDDGINGFSGGDTLLSTVTNFASINNGYLPFDISSFDGDPAVQASPANIRSFLVVVEMEADAVAQSPDQFLVTVSSDVGAQISTIEDSSNDAQLFVTGQKSGNDIVISVQNPPGTVVNNIGDAPDASPGDGNCETATVGQCTLRAAIQESNALAGTQTIDFSIAGAGPHTIVPGSALPTITQPVIINGTSEPDYVDQPVVSIDGSGAGATNGLTIAADDVTVRGLAIVNYGGNNIVGNGIEVQSGANTVIAGNYLGTSNGTNDAGNNAGVFVSSATTNTLIGGAIAADRNVISGNTFGVYLANANGTQIRGNYIGTNATGAAALANSDFGIAGDGGSGYIIDNNLISGNGEGIGLYIFSYATGASNSTVTGNLIGTNAAGNAAIPNIADGVRIADGANNVIGGDTAAERNIISGNAQVGVQITGPAATNNTVSGNYIGTTSDGVADLGNGSTGVLIVNGSSNNLIGGPSAGQGNLIVNNADDGVRLTADAGNNNSIRGNQIVGNGGLGIDLGIDGVNANDTNDGDTGANGLQNFPVLTPSEDLNGTIVQGTLNSTPGANFTLDFYSSPECDASGNGEGPLYLGNIVDGVDGSGNGSFTFNLPGQFLAGQYIIATATATDGSSSEFSACAPVATNNLWTGAFGFPLNGSPNSDTSTGTVNQFLTDTATARWYKFNVTPGSNVRVEVNAPTGSIVTLHKDVQSTYDDLLLPESEAAAGASSLPGGYLPGGYLPGGYLPEVYSGAQYFSLMAVAFDPNATFQTIERNTFSLAESLYVRVAGPASATPIEIKITLNEGICGDVELPSANLASIAGALPGSDAKQTVILWDSLRMRANYPTMNLTSFAAKLQELANHSAVAGVLIYLAAKTGTGPNDWKYPRVRFTHEQADRVVGCAEAKSIVADEITKVVKAYRAANVANNVTTLKYVTIVGSDDEIPFQRLPDLAGLAGEDGYIPPVGPLSATEASLRTAQIQSQDLYGSRLSIWRGSFDLPIPDLAVGRLVKTPSDITGLIDAFIAANGRVAPRSALVTGYDFVADGAELIEQEINKGLNLATCATSPNGCINADRLIQPERTGSNELSAWTGNELRSKLFSRRNDLIFFTGHFYAGGLIAADNTSGVLASEVLNEPGVSFTNSIVFALGCHSGFSLPPSGITSSSPVPDWSEAFARRGATYVAATGYAYGDTELAEYGERLMINLSKALRTGTGPVAVGSALVDAKIAYLAGKPSLSGLDEKTLLQFTVYGLPMIAVDMPGQRILDVGASVIGNVENVTSGPGTSFGLGVGEVAGGSQTVSIDSTLTRTDRALTNENGGAVTASYLSGSDGVVAMPIEPILPLESENVSYASKVLRGTLFMGGTYNDLNNFIPLTSAATTEGSRAHPAFYTDTFYPSQNWGVNLYAAIDGGPTFLQAVVGQYKSNALSSISGKLRAYEQMDFKLFYMADNWADDQESRVAAVAPAPQVLFVESSRNGVGKVEIKVNLLYNPAVGVQQAVVTWTNPNASGVKSWQSFSLVADPNDPTLFSSPAGGVSMPSGAVFMVQAVNGAGLVGVDANQGEYYSVPPTTPEPPPPPAVATAIEALTVPNLGYFEQTASFSVRLRQVGAASLANQPMSLIVGGLQAVGSTNSRGVANFALPINLAPGSYPARFVFTGTDGLEAALFEFRFSVERENTSLDLTPVSSTASVGGPTELFAELTAAGGKSVDDRTIIFIGSGQSGSFAQTAKTNFNGQAVLGIVTWPAGTYSVRAYFAGTIPLPGGAVVLNDQFYNPASDGPVSLTLTSGTAALINSAAVTTGVINSAYRYDVNATGSPQPYYAFVGTPPAGMTINGETGLISWLPTTAGSYPVTVRAANSVNPDATQSFSIVVASTANPLKISPVLERGGCVVANGNGTFTAYFGYSNPNSFAVTIPVGNDNKFTPNPQGRGQTTTFLPGRQTSTFSVIFSGGNLVWTLNGKTSTASSGRVCNQPPVAVNDTATVSYRGTATINVRANDSDPDSNPLTITAAGSATKGTVSINADGTLRYVHTSSFGLGTSATDSFSYTISDGNGGTATASVTVTIRRAFACSVLDNFNRTNGGLNSGGKPWNGSAGLGGYGIRSNQVQTFGGGPIYWKGPTYSANQAACIKLTAIPSATDEIGLLLKVQSTPNWREGAIDVNYYPALGVVRVDTFQKNNNGPFNGWRHYAPIAASFVPGDLFAAIAWADGKVQIFKNGLLIGTSDTGGNSLTTAGAATFSGNGTYFVNRNGRIGLWNIRATDLKFDDFGGGSVTP